MINKGFITKFVVYSSIVVMGILGTANLFAMPYVASQPGDSLPLAPNNIILEQPDDSATMNAFIAPADSVGVASDSAAINAQRKSDIDDPVKYSSRDSLFFDMENRTVHLYGDAKVTYQKIELTAAYIEFNMVNQTVYASGMADSTGEMTGIPHFKEGSEEFDAHWLRYNFKTRKGFVYFVKSKQSDGTLIGDSTKRNPDGQVHLKGAKYSTCDLDHPHFYLRLTKAKAVPNDKIVSGPAYLVVADIPLPLIIPFGYFPNTSDFSSGLLMPTWGEERTRGFYINRGGYYFAVSDYFDGQITGDIYSKGSWGTNVLGNYKKRYRFGGSFNFSYYNNVTGEKGLPDHSEVKDYSIRWNHTQDAKANPNVNFSANVTLSSSSYDRNNARRADNYLTNTRSSSVSYSRRWPTIPFNFSSSLQHNQNSRTKDVNMTLPNVSVDMTKPYYPFRKEGSTGELKWYEDIQINYRASMRNEVKTKDSLFLTNRMWDNMRNGAEHSLPLSTNIKISRFINLSPSVQYKGYLYTEQIRMNYNPNKLAADGLLGATDTIIEKGLVYAHSYFPSASLGYNPKLYGMYMFKNSRVKALRHVMSPYASLSYRPDVSSFVPNYYDTYKTRDGRSVRYSYFDGSIYGTPSPAPGQSAVVGFGLRNNFEMKYMPKADTATKDKKLSLLRNLDFSGSYDLLADSFNLSTISMNTSTALFNDKMDIQFNAQFDPYNLDSAGRRTASYLIYKNNGLARLTSANISIGTSFRSTEGKGQATNTTKRNTDIDRPFATGMTNDFDDDEINFDIPWSISISYTWSYSKPGHSSSLTQSLSASGDLSLTKKWKIGYSSGFDFESMDFTYTRINISRDLHCWEMRFDWVPFGYRTEYNFTISARGMLQDLKYNKSKPWRDNRSF